MLELRRRLRQAQDQPHGGDEKEGGEGEGGVSEGEGQGSNRSEAGLKGQGRGREITLGGAKAFGWAEEGGGGRLTEQSGHSAD